MPHLTNDNYNLWANQAEANLIWRGIWYLIEEEFKPTEPIHDDVIRQRERDNGQGRAFLLGAVGVENIGHIITLRTLKEQWNKLKQVHVSTKKVRLMDLLKQFFTYRTKTNENVHKIASRLTALQTEIAAISPVEKPTDNMKIMVLYEALGDAFKVITEILQSAEESDFDKIVRRLRDTEESSASRNKPQTESALATRGDRSRSSSKFRGKCNHCKKPGQSEVLAMGNRKPQR